MALPVPSVSVGAPDGAPPTRPAVKVVMRGATTSFRYPHFLQGVQPTYEMPPPSTIYGHVCSAFGYPVDRAGLEFAVHFTYGAKQRDIEHTHLEVPYIQANPFQREILFFPRLTLYLAAADLGPILQAFRAPHFPVVLGRSQDLMTYESVSVVTLQQAEQAYFEHTLIPAPLAVYFTRSIAVTMARHIDPISRQPEWGYYAILKERQRYPDEDAPEGATFPPVWVDPDPDDPTTRDPDPKAGFRGLIFNPFMA